MRHLILPTLLLLAACGGNAAPTGAVIYVALDQEFSQPLLQQWSKELNLPIQQRYDTEASKTVGLVSSLKEERSAPRCDVFWNNEIANTVNLAQDGMLMPYESPAAKDIPAQWRDPKGCWTGFAARARVIVVNTELLPDPKDWPTSYKDLANPKWKGRCAVAKPLTGTTLTHFTALKKVLGDADFDEFFSAIQKNDVKFLSSNGATLRETRDGKVAWAFTDTDDYHVAHTKGFKVACVFPDQGEGEIGTMLIPNAVGILKGCPNPEAAKRLVDKIVSRETEALLAAADGAQIPLREGVPGPKDPAIKSVGQFRMMQWDLEWAGQNISRCSQEFGKRFGQ